MDIPLFRTLISRSSASSGQCINRWYVIVAEEHRQQPIAAPGDVVGNIKDADAYKSGRGGRGGSGSGLAGRSIGSVSPELPPELPGTRRQSAAPGLLLLGGTPSLSQNHGALILKLLPLNVDLKLFV